MFVKGNYADFWNCLDATENGAVVGWLPRGVVRVPWAGPDIGLVGLVRAEKRRQAAALHMVPREVLSGSFCDGTAGRQDGEKKRHDN